MTVAVTKLEHLEAAPPGFDSFADGRTPDAHEGRFAVLLPEPVDYLRGKEKATLQRLKRSGSSADEACNWAQYHRMSSMVTARMGCISCSSTTLVARSPMPGNSGGATVRSVHAGRPRSTAAWRSRKRPHALRAISATHESSNCSTVIDANPAFVP